jgi:U4/U6.U5 tri-snRNP-associated protein 1
VDKRKWSKFMGVDDDDDRKSEIRIDRRDEFGRIMTPKEAFRMISHKFHGIVPGKKKQEKRMKQYQQELKLKQMKINHSDTPSPSVERMREAQRQLEMPYLVLSSFVKPHDTTTGKGFANVDHERELCRGGHKKLVPFLVKKRKAAEPKP